MPLVALTLFPAVGVAVVGLIVLGVGYATIEVAGLTLVQRLASDAVLARAFGVVEGTYWLTTGIGSLLAPLLVVVFGLRGAILIVGLTLPLVVLARWRALWHLEASTPVPEAEYGLLRSVDMFALAAGGGARGPRAPRHPRPVRGGQRRSSARASPASASS